MDDFLTLRVDQIYFLLIPLLHFFRPPGFADGAGQPYMLTMIRALEDLGFNTGNPNKQAIARINDYCKTIRPLYTSAAQMRGPDLAVEVSGIAGGQRTILDKELTDAGQPELIPKVDKEVVVVRAEGGKVR